MNVEERLLNAGFEDVKYITDYSYDDALIGVTTDGQAVYDYDRMIDWLIETKDMSEDDAIDYVNYNTLRDIPYMGSDAPIVIYSLENFE